MYIIRVLLAETQAKVSNVGGVSQYENCVDEHSV